MSNFRKQVHTINALLLVEILISYLKVLSFAQKTMIERGDLVIEQECSFT